MKIEVKNNKNKKKYTSRLLKPVHCLLKTKDSAGKADTLNKCCYSLFRDLIILLGNYEIFSILTLASGSKYV